MTDSNTDGSGVAGQGGLTAGTDDFNSLAFMMERALARISTMKMVKVVAVKNAGEVAAVGMVDVQPLVKQQDGLGNATSHGTIFGVPYFRVQGGKNAVIIDPQVGDIGMMVCADRDSSAVKDAKAEANPGSFRTYDAADGVYVGGILNGVPDQYVRFSDSGVSLADKNGNKLESSATGWLFTGIVSFAQNVQFGGSVKSLTGATYAGNIVTSGDITAGSTSLRGHVHGGVQPGSSNTSGPV